MRRILFLAAAALVAGLGAADRPHAAERSHADDLAPLTLGTAELQSIAVRRSPQRAEPVEGAVVKPAEPAPAPSVLVPEHVSLAEPAIPEQAPPVVEITDVATATPPAIVLAPAELQAVGPRAKSELPATPSSQPRPSRLVFAPARTAPPVLVPGEPATSIEIVEPSPGLPPTRADDGPAALDDLGLQAIGIRIGAGR